MNDPTTTIIKPPVNDKGFGRRVAHDLRDANYRAATRLPQLSAINRTYRHWYKAPKYLPLDQGRTSECTAFSAETLLYLGPVTTTRVPDPHGLYKLAQQNDEWPGEDYEGSSVRGAMKALQSLGYIQNYLWAHNWHEAAVFLLEHGPVVLGTSWTDEMCYPEKIKDEFWLNVELKLLDDADVAGHAIAICSVNTEKQCPDGTRGVFEMLNTWGPTFGENGRVNVPANKFDALIQIAGELALPTEIKVK